MLAKGQTSRERRAQSYGSRETAGLPTTREMAELPNQWFGFFIMEPMRMMRPKVAQRRGMLKNERGSALGMILVLGFVMGTVGYIMLILAGSQSGQSQGMQERAKAQYLAEAGYVLVSRKLMNPAWRNYPDAVSCAIVAGKSHCTIVTACIPAVGNDAQSVEFIDANGDGVIGPPDVTDPSVEVTVQNCGVAPGPPPAPRPHTIKIKAHYS